MIGLVRRSMVIGLFALLMLGLAAPAWAQVSDTTEAFVVLSGRADVPKGQTVGDLVVFHGSATVDGTVDGSLTAFDAPVTISGQVNGDVVAFNGRVVLRSGANVTGDVVSQQAPVVASGATIGGTTKRVQTNTNWEGFGWAGKLAWWLAVSVSTLVVGLVLVWLAGRGAAGSWRPAGPASPGHRVGAVGFRPPRPASRHGDPGWDPPRLGVWPRGVDSALGTGTPGSWDGGSR